MRAILSTAESVQKAEQLIKNKEWNAAAEIYRQLNERMPAHERFYERLMMLYRRMNLPQKELAIINKGIKNISTAFHARGDKLFGKNTSVKRISNSLMKSLGLKNSNGKHLFEPDKVVAWRKRREIVLKKLKKQKVNK